MLYNTELELEILNFLKIQRKNEFFKVSEITKKICCTACIDFSYCTKKIYGCHHNYCSASTLVYKRIFAKLRNLQKLNLVEEKKILSPRKTFVYLYSFNFKFK